MSEGSRESFLIAFLQTPENDTNKIRRKRTKLTREYKRYQNPEFPDAIFFQEVAPHEEDEDIVEEGNDEECQPHEAVHDEPGPQEVSLAPQGPEGQQVVDDEGHTSKRQEADRVIILETKLKNPALFISNLLLFLVNPPRRF